jgi:hypothetical protein
MLTRISGLCSWRSILSIVQEALDSQGCKCSPPNDMPTWQPPLLHSCQGIRHIHRTSSSDWPRHADCYASLVRNLTKRSYSHSKSAILSHTYSTFGLTIPNLLCGMPCELGVIQS